MRKLGALTAALTLASLLMCGPSPVHAAEPGDGKPVKRDQDVEIIRPVDLEHRFFFRFRPELLLGGSLGPGSSPIPEPLVSTPLNGDEDASTLAWASVRLRYEPTFKLGSAFEIHASIEVLRNLLLGSTHVNAGGDFDQGLWRHGQGSPVGGINSFQDAVEIRELYGVWRVFDVLELSGGRFAQHWGLGIFRNDGRGDDADFGTIIDAAQLGLTIAGIRFEAAWEFTGIGATTTLPADPGQPQDLGEDDDITTYTIRAFSRPLTPEDQAAREHLLFEERKPAVDWGALLTFTDQTYDSYIQSASDQCEPLASTKNGLLSLPYECYQLIPRNAFFFRPSLWGRVEWWPSHTLGFRAELELSMVVGDVENLQGDPDLEDTAKDFLAGGGALELELTYDHLHVGLDLGFATGDDRQYLGYQDGQNIVEPDDSQYEINDNVRLNDTVSSFWFNRDYRIDLILFRQVIGGVTNAVYLKPWVSYDLLELDADTTLNLRLDLLYAAAVDPSGTPGAGAHYGVEIDGHVTLKTAAGFEAGLSAGVLLPLDALSDRETGADAEPAFALRGLFIWRY